MAHLKNAQKGISDCNKVQYHNKNFKTAAESFGLTVSQRKGKGWATTVLGQTAKDAILLLKPDVDAYKIVRKPPEIDKPDPTTIQLSIDISYEDKINELLEFFGKKRALAEEAINLLYQKTIKSKVEEEVEETEE